MKKYVSIFLFFIVFVCVSIYCVILNDQDCVNNIKLLSYLDGFETKISLFESQGKYYAFIPSHFQLENTFFEYTSGCSLYLNDKKYTSLSSCSDLQVEKEYEMVIKNTFGFVTSKETLVLYKTRNMPSMFIDISDGTIKDVNSDKTVQKTGTCIAVNNRNEINYNGTFDNIQGRGGYTWSQEKKPYNLCFSKEVNLFDMGLATDWVLLSNPLDKSHLRNKVIYDISNECGLRFSPDSCFVNLYIDNEYCGLYLLTEKIEIHPNRVNISNLYEQTKTLNQAPLYTYSCVQMEQEGIYKKSYDIPVVPPDITGGYLLELQHYAGRTSHNSAFTTKDSICFSFKSSPYVSKEQLDYISGFIQDVEDSFHNGDYEKYIDVNSWVKYYLIQEVFGNADNRSFFYYKNSDSVDGKLYAGPVWDYDIAWGNHSIGPEVNPRAFYINTWGWYSTLYEYDSFKTRLVTEYSQNFKPILSELIDKTIYDYQAQIESSYIMDKQRWLYIQPTNRSDSYDTLGGHIEWLRSYLNQRISFLDEVWLEQKPVYTVTAISKTSDPAYSHKYYYSVSAGEQIAQLPVLSEEGYKFLGWVDSTTLEEYDPTEILTSNKTFQAKWEVDSKQTASVESDTLVVRLSRVIENNIELLFVLFLFSMMVIFVFFNFYIEYKNKKGDLNGRFK